MDFSVSGSDSWETTGSQENFIESYFQKPKVTVENISTKILKKKRKNTADSNLVKKTQHSLKKTKPVKVPTEKICSQSTEMDTVVKIPQHRRKKKLKTIKGILQSTTINPLSERHEDSENNDDFICTENKLLQKHKKLNKNIIALKKCKKDKTERKKEKSVSAQNATELSNSHEPNTLSKKSKTLRKKKAKKSLKETLEPNEDLQEGKKEKSVSAQNATELSNSHEPNTLPKKSKTLRKKKAQKSLKEEPNEDLQDVEKNSDDSVQESDVELISEIKMSNVFKEIKELLKRAPHLSNLKDSNESFDELSAEDSDESFDELSAEDSDESFDEQSKDSDESTEDASSIMQKVDKMTKRVKGNRELSESKNVKSFSIGKTNNSGDRKSLPDKACDVEKDLKQDDNPTIQNVLNSKKTALSLKSKAQQKLQAAKFRYLNEKLYTESGASAFQYFQENVDEFHDYHQGYSLQVSKWPMNPVTKIISDLQNLNKNTVIADMGCGDAKIAQTLRKSTVHSFDIVALNELVTPCDISKVPLPKESVDVVVFCLSLMGINLKEYLIEAHRILKMGGTLKIAEVESRITDVNMFIKGLKCLGFSLQNQDLKHKIFVFLDLKKQRKKLKGAKIPNITLRPCLYKKR